MAFEVVDGPRIEARAERPSLGIRIVTPFRGMLAVRDALITELSSWLDDHHVAAGGPFFLRLHRVDMAGDMEIEVGLLDTIAPGDERVRAGSSPAGEYAVLAYRGSSMQANRMLLTWAPAQSREFAAEPQSGEWDGRFEILRTDPRVERRKTAWTTELAFLLR
ncbi:hypothetical protein ACFY9N_15270 [Microbacterium sp. NPDC008134]|uniref:hypothetical protein n=1 Tax=Microbacterium sp. NPDC008134 TaxID=3364183 RepID=UPI0036E31A6E